MPSSAGDYLEGVLANQATNLILVFIIAVSLVVMQGSAPNRFITGVLLVAGAFVGWLLGVAYGKRKTYRTIATQSKGAGR